MFLMRQSRCQKMQFDSHYFTKLVVFHIYHRTKNKVYKALFKLQNLMSYQSYILNCLENNPHHNLSKFRNYERITALEQKRHYLRLMYWLLTQTCIDINQFIYVCFIDFEKFFDGIFYHGKLVEFIKKENCE